MTTPFTTNDTALDSFFDKAQPTPNFDSQLNSNLNDDIEQIEIAVAEDENQNQNDDDDNGFDILGLAPVLLKSIEATGYTTPTPIQAQAIPAALNGRDLLLSAQTGSGKTAAFVLPILHNIHHAPKDSKGRQPKAVKALILTPTRELAHQVGDSIRKYGSSMRDLFSVPLVGGAAYSGQIRALKKGVQIIVATPGRLLDHINAGRVDLSSLEMLVLDEADRMLDMGFADDIEAILKATPANRQTIMSSATWDGPVGKIAESFTENPERISIKVETAHIDEKVYFCDNFDHKNKLLESLICDQDRDQAIIFTATKRSSEELAERLQAWGHKACYLHGDLPQSKRNRIVADLRSGKHDIVVATDVAARGIDLPNITHVFNYDLPRQVEDYVHRIGRSGRAGRTGIAINLCSRDDRRQFGNIMRYLKRDIQESTVEGLEPRFVEKFDSRGRDGGKGRGRDGSRSGGRGRNGNRDRYAENRFDSRSNDRFESRSRSDRSERFEGRGERSDNRFAKGSASDFYEKRQAKKSDNSDNFDKKPRFNRDEAVAPRRRREDSRDSVGDNRSYNSEKPRFEKRSNDERFERAAKSSDKFQSDKSRFDRSDRFGDSKRFDDKPFGKKPFGKKPFEGKSEGFGKERYDDQAFDKKPRKSRGVTEQTFGKDGAKDKPRSEKKFDKPFKKSDKSEKFGKSKDFSDKPRFAKSNKDGNDGWDAPKRSRRNSTGKPL